MSEDKAVDNPVEDDKAIDDADVLDFGKKKKKKKTKKPGEKGVEGNEESFVDGSGLPFEPTPFYEYEMLLERIQRLIAENNPNLQGSRKYTIKPPLVTRVGSRRVAWTNYREICNIMRRSQDHVYQFVLAELGTEGSIAGEGQLVLKGRYGPKHIESLLRKYITEYVTCSMCRSPQTTLERDSRTRLYTISCAACGANRSVSAIRTGFHAVSRADRRKAKNAM